MMGTIRSKCHTGTQAQLYNKQYIDPKIWVGSNALNATQGHRPSYTTSYIVIPNDGEDPSCLDEQGFRFTLSQ